MKNLPRIICESIPHSEQRYDTCGDYVEEYDEWYFTISKMKADYEFLVLMHELTEWYLTQKRGIKEQDITKFDIKFEEDRAKGLHNEIEEPGFHKDAPYINEHKFATKIEKLLAKELGINWNEYDKTILKLLWKRKK